MKEMWLRFFHLFSFLCIVFVFFRSHPVYNTVLFGRPASWLLHNSVFACVSNPVEQADGNKKKRIYLHMGERWEKNLKVGRLSDCHRPAAPSLMRPYRLMGLCSCPPCFISESKRTKFHEYLVCVRTQLRTRFLFTAASTALTAVLVDGR